MSESGRAPTTLIAGSVAVSGMGVSVTVLCWIE
ncbi:Uncharacterised protein [Bordetella pertussis]|nr:Uncharacterised protein [Bordetella pertussis]CPN02314.1 Uncharacterised protein [Bordetella pertussis]